MARPLAVSGLLWLVIVLFAAPSSLGLPLVPTASHAVPHAVPGHLGISAAVRTATHVTSPATALLPGSDPSVLTPVDSPAIAAAQFASQIGHPVNWSQVAEQAHAGSAGFSPTSPVAAAPAPAITIPVATFVGTVKNYSGKPISGVLVQAYSVAIALCPQNICPSVTTNSTGGFTVKGPAGADYIVFTLSYYLDNLTYVTGFASQTTFLNYTIYMVQEATAIGTVQANSSSHRAINGVTVKALSRDLSLIGNPSGSTSGTGAFKIGVPPAPATISFSPPYGFLSTFVYVNATPGETINLGVIYLVPDPSVKATLYDAVTGQKVPSGGCPNQCHAIVVCSSATNACLSQGPATGSATVQALGPRGYDYVKAFATGYLENNVPIGLVTGPVDVGKILMVPLATISLKVSITHNSTSLPSLGTGLWTAAITSMQGYRAGFATFNPATYTYNMSSSSSMGGCGSPNGGSTLLGAFPLRNDVTLSPDTNAQCMPPNPTWPLPNFLPVWGNETYVNATSDMATPAVLNLTPGNYVYGNVTVGGTNSPPTGGFTVTGFSTDNPSLTAYGFSSLTSPWGCSPYPKTSTGFCVPVPPGPGKIVVQSLTQSYAQNYTWGSTPYMCCYRPIEPMTLNHYTGGSTAGFTSVNMSALGTVYGRVFRGNTNLGVFFGAIKVTAAGTQPNLPTFSGPIFINGTFNVQSPTGWVEITASASGFASNTVWAFVNPRTNVSIGNISLTPLATVQGQIIDPTGHGIYDANVQYCHIDTPSGCSSLGAGLSTSDGQFNGTLLGGWLPWSTYEIRVGASGYTSDWSWVNATAGQTTYLRPITLFPLGTNTTAGAVPRPSSGGSKAAGVWIDGAILDDSTGWGIASSSIQACPTNGYACDQFNLSNTDGVFNDSVAPSSYNLIVSPAGFRPFTVFFNASQAAVVHVGFLRLTPLPWVTGRANISPFGDISVARGSSWVRIELAPPSTALACNQNGSQCGVANPISSQGGFTVQTPGGIYNRVQVIPSGGTIATSNNGGFSSNSTIYNVTENVTNLTNPIPLPIYTMVGGYVYDNSTFGPGGIKPWLPARWTPVSIATFGPNHQTGAWTTNGGGFYEFFVPAGPNRTFVLAGTLPEATVPANATSTQILNNTMPPSVAMMPQINLTHYGWIDLLVKGSINSTPAAYVGVFASYFDVLNSTTLTGNGATNAFGFANVSAPPGHPVLVQVGPGSDLNGTNFTTWVNSSAATYINGTQVTHMDFTWLNAWGWVRSTALNNTTLPNVPTVVDKVNGLPLPLSSLTVSSSMPGLSGSGVSTNWMGEFITDAPIGQADSVATTHWAYLSNTTRVALGPAETVTERTINLTGIGVLAGTVVSWPNLLPVPFATIQTCPYNATGSSNCYYATANASGFFWVASFPGRVTVTGASTGFVTNTAVAQSCSDCWNYLNPIVLSEFSYVTGTIRGLPSGSILVNATVSACSPLGHPVGACGFSVVTPVTGSFLLAVPSGQYILQANRTGYNTSYLPIGLVAGEILPVGIIFLKQFGTALGTVISSSTFLPVPNAAVFACASWSGGGCTPQVTTDALGRFTLSAAPGPYTLTVLAGGYADSYSSATLRSGATSTLTPILVNPLGVDIAYPVAGQVISAIDPTQGIPAANVAVLLNGTPVASVQTSSNGAFAMSVLYGVYTLKVSAAGYAPASQPITVHGVVSGLIIPLAVMTFQTTGTITDGLTGQLLAGVAVEENGIILAVTDVNGQYALVLANGTHSLTATYAGGGTVEYGLVAFSITVNGANQVHDLQLLPPTVAIHGVVADSIAGTPLAGAAVSVRGTTVDGVPVSQTLVADPGGGFTVTLPLGSYNASATYTGYHSATKAFPVTTAGGSVSILLAPTTSSGGSGVAPSGMTALIVLVAALGVIVVAVVALGLLVAGRARTARRRAEPRAAAKAAPQKRGPG